LIAKKQMNVVFIFVDSPFLSNKIIVLSRV